MVLKQSNTFNWVFFRHASLKNSSIALLFKDFLPRLTKKDCAKICYLISAPFLSVMTNHDRKNFQFPKFVNSKIITFLPLPLSSYTLISRLHNFARLLRI